MGTKGGIVDDEKKRVLQDKTQEQRQAADWRDTFSTKQQDKARFFITLVTSETFAIGLSLNTMPPQKWLWPPCAATFLICFGACFWSIFHFVKVISPRTFRATNEGVHTHDQQSEEQLLHAHKKMAEAQNERLDQIVDEQGLHLKRGIRSFIVFNVIFALALLVSRLAWFFPES